MSDGTSNSVIDSLERSNKHLDSVNKQLEKQIQKMNNELIKIREDVK